VFSEPDDFQAALREDGVLGMLITGSGRFRARLTQITLHCLRLLAAEEHLPRIAFVAVPADTVLVLLPIGGGSSPIWGGIAMRAGEIITIGPDQRAHGRTDGPCRWGTIRLPARDLARYGRALSGAGSPFLNLSRDGDRRRWLAWSCASSIKPPSVVPKLGRLLSSRHTCYCSNLGSPSTLGKCLAGRISSISFLVSGA
jgi:hypothetical protein